MKIKSVIFYMRHPRLVFLKIGQRTYMKNWSDEKYLKKLYRIRMGKKLDLENPETFNEKLQWLKIHDRKPEYTQMVDKAEAKKIVAEKIGEEYIIPTLGVYEKWDDIDFEKLPNSFVIKCTHDSGGLVIVKDKNGFDKKAAKKKINKSLKRNYYYGSREWPYKDVKPRIIIEEFMVDPKTNSEFGLVDYKFYCFNGEPKFLYVSRGLGGDHRFAEMSFYYMDWEKTEFYRPDFKGMSVNIKRPITFSKMIDIARKLSKRIPFLRVDLYEINSKIYFSELTFFPGSGFMVFKPEGSDEKLGSLLVL